MRNPHEIDPTKLSTKEQETASLIMPKIPTITLNEVLPPETQHQYATCNKEYGARKGRLMRQKRSTKCHIQPNPPIIRPIICPNRNCDKILPSQKQLENTSIFTAMAKTQCTD